MLYRINIIIILFSSLLAQAQFNRIIPQSYYFGDARSMGIGNTYLTTDLSSFVTMSNPAKLSRINNAIYIQTNLFSISERRSIIIKDNWGDFLAETDYVFNQNNYLKNSIGVNFKVSLNPFIDDNKFNFGVGVTYSPLLSMNYSYEEEVRSNAGLADGIIGIDDPIIGFHILKNTCDLYVQSAALSLSINRKHNNYLAFGLGINKIQSTTLKDEIYVNIIDNTYYEDNNITPAESFSEEYKIDGLFFLSASMEIKNKNTSFVFSYIDEQKIETDSTSLISVSNHLGLPLLFEIDEDNDSLIYANYGFKYHKPKEYNLGILYHPGNISNFSIALEVTNKKWRKSDIIPGTKESIYEYRFGFEYAPINSFPIRAGLVYSESPFVVLDPNTILTLGTGKSFGRINLDLAMNYSNNYFLYYDLFPDDNDFNYSCEEVGCDKIREDNLNFLSTITINF